MRTFSFHKYSPGGNMTALIQADNESLTPAQRARIAARVMAPDHLGAEQVGFVRLRGERPRLDMMGGEFCVNASRAFAALLLDADRLSPFSHESELAGSGWRGGEMEVSGLDAPLPVFAREVVAGLCEAAARLNRPEAPLERPGAGLCLVRLPGIVHLVLDEARHPLPSPWEAEVRNLLERYGLLAEEAAGCIWLRRPERATDPWRLTPFVHVRETSSTCAESACGSGSLAAALSLAESASAAYRFRQPGGEDLSVRLNAQSAWISGPVRLIARGEVFVDDQDCAD